MRPFFGIRRGLLFLITAMTVLSMNHVFAQTEWEKHPDNPVLNLGYGSAWDHDMVSASAVIFDGKIYKMWYTGGDTLRCRIGYATIVIQKRILHFGSER
jgi:hypothetical protein